MSFWKIAAGAVVGVGAIAAAPFTGGGSLFGAATLIGSLTGATTIAAATAAGAAGAVAGYAAAQSDEEQAEAYRNQGRSDAGKDIANLKTALDEYETKLNDARQYFDLLVALSAVGFATANCDGYICDAEVDDINEFVSGVAASHLPDNIKKSIQSFKTSPPTIGQAYDFASNLQDYPKELFDQTIEMVMHSDGVVHAAEVQFKKKWQVLNAA
tara:strand:+ start:64 stop:702 length:639 start_codon:yes stop_codon:yes gene_type:complete